MLPQVLDLSHLFVLSLILVFLLTVLVDKVKRYDSDFPPGPMALPIVGNLHQIAWRGVNNLQQLLIEWANQYGDMFTLVLGQDKCIVLNKHELMKEAFSMSVFSGRPDNFLKIFHADNTGIVFADGQQWLIQRRFTELHLKNLGFGTSKYEGRILDEISLALREFEKLNGKPCNPQTLLAHVAANIEVVYLWGRRFEYSDTRFQWFLMQVQDVVRIGNDSNMLYHVMPFLRHLPGDLLSINKMLSKDAKIDAFIKEIIEEHRQKRMEFGRALEAEDYLDFYLDEMENGQQNDAWTFNERQLTVNLRDFCLAGFSTLPHTMHWGILFLAANPRVQEKAAKIVRDVIGNQPPSLDDRPRLPYIEAVVMETHRLARMASTGVPHAALEDVVFHGYRIKKGTSIIPNMAAMFLDESLFPNPYTFNPERFMDEDGKFDTSLADKLYPFSIGKRMCPGKQMAEKTMFLFFTSILQKLRVCWPEGANAPAVVGGIQGFVYAPKPYKICFRPRI